MSRRDPERIYEAQRAGVFARLTQSQQSTSWAPSLGSADGSARRRRQPGPAAHTVIIRREIAHAALRTARLALTGGGERRLGGNLQGAIADAENHHRGHNPDGGHDRHDDD